LLFLLKSVCISGVSIRTIICLLYYKIGQRAKMWGLGKKIVYHIQQFNPSKDYYKILGLSKDATKDQIKKSFRNLAKTHHPDSKNGN
jgi:preprotein translocase subunit Sec63